MSVDDEIYFEAHEEELIELYADFLAESGLTEIEYSLADFRRDY